MTVFIKMHHGSPETHINVNPLLVLGSGTLEVKVIFKVRSHQHLHGNNWFSTRIGVSKFL